MKSKWETVAIHRYESRNTELLKGHLCLNGIKYNAMSHIFGIAGFTLDEVQVFLILLFFTFLARVSLEDIINIAIISAC